MLSVTESAEVLGITPARVRELIAEGTLPASKVGRTWTLREADVAERMHAGATPGRPKTTKKYAAHVAEPEPKPDEERLVRMHELYEMCRSQFAQCPSTTELAALENDEERAFRVAISDFFLQQKQHELVRQGVY